MIFFISSGVLNVLHWLVPVLFRAPRGIVVYKKGLKIRIAEPQLNVAVNVTQLLFTEK